MVQLKHTIIRKMPPGWQRTYQSERATRGTLERGDVQTLIARLSTNSIHAHTHFNDGYISFYLTKICRTEYLEGDLAGCVVEGYLNNQSIRGYAILCDEDNTTKMLLTFPTYVEKHSIAALRRCAMTVAKYLGWIRKDPYPLYG